MDAAGGALGSVTCAQGQHLNVPYTDGSAVTCHCEDAWAEPQRARRSHREQLRQELRLDAAPRRCTALHDSVTMAQVAKAVLTGDAETLKCLLKSNSLWRGPNPSIIACDLQMALGTQSCRASKTS